MGALDLTPYIDAGYQDRRSYLAAMAEERGLKQKTVFELAEILGPEEDFDMLITQLDELQED